MTGNWCPSVALFFWVPPSGRGTYCDIRFVKDMGLLFCLANTRMRHEVNQAASAKVHSSGRAFKQFKEAINDEDFEGLLKNAQADYKGVAAQDFLKKVLPFLSISGRQVPWGNAEKNAEVTKLMAENRWHGPGSHFLNLAPYDVHNPSAVRLCKPLVGYDQAPAQAGDDDGPARVRGSGGGDGGGSGGGSDCAFLRTLRGGTPANRAVDDFDMSEAALQKLVAANPVAATLVFQATVQNAVKHIINTHPARKTNHLICGSDKGIKDAHKPVALGVSNHFTYVAENNGRGSSQIHALNGAGASPRLLADIASYPRRTRRHRDAAGRQPAAGVPPRRHRSESAKGVGAS